MCAVRTGRAGRSRGAGAGVMARTRRRPAHGEGGGRPGQAQHRGTGGDGDEGGDPDGSRSRHDRGYPAGDDQPTAESEPGQDRCRPHLDRTARVAGGDVDDGEVRRDRRAVDPGESTDPYLSPLSKHVPDVTTTRAHPGSIAGPLEPRPRKATPDSHGRWPMLVRCAWFLSPDGDAADGADRPCTRSGPLWLSA